jgi:hypothetical protein
LLARRRAGNLPSADEQIEQKMLDSPFADGILVSVFTVFGSRQELPG